MSKEKYVRWRLINFKHRIQDSLREEKSLKDK